MVDTIFYVDLQNAQARNKYVLIALKIKMTKLIIMKS